MNFNQTNIPVYDSVQIYKGFMKIGAGVQMRANIFKAPLQCWGPQIFDSNDPHELHNDVEKGVIFHLILQ